VAKRKQKSYDRIFRENIEPLVVPLAHRLLDLTIPALEEIPDDLHQTIERKPDFLKKVVFPEGVGSYILHFEFQTTDDPEMLERMLEYYAMLWRKYQLPVRQYVFYIGEGVSQMRHGLYQESLQYQYRLISRLISASEVAYRLFLNSATPEKVLLTILSDFGQANTGDIVGSIISKLDELVPRSLRRKRYLKQLEILSQLRNLQEVVINVSEKMALVYELKKDIRYQQGIEQSIVKMIRKGSFFYELIAETFDVPIGRVRAIAQQINNQK
jgi:hypothetical protein